MVLENGASGDNFKAELSAASYGYVQGKLVMHRPVTDTLADFLAGRFKAREVERPRWTRVLKRICWLDTKVKR